MTNDREARRQAIVELMQISHRLLYESDLSNSKLAQAIVDLINWLHEYWTD